MNKGSITFQKSNPAFTKALKQNVDQYFQSNHLSKTGNRQLYIKGAVLFIAGFLLYSCILCGQVSFWGKLICYIFLGLDFAFIGFNVMHDAGHGSYSSNPTVNRIMAGSLNVMGGSMQLWKVKHNILHHTFTNIEGEDDDIDIKPFIRTNQYQKQYYLHRFQHLYFIPLYALTYLAWIWYRDFAKYFTLKVQGRAIPRFNYRQHIGFWLTKVMYTLLLLVIPGLVIGWKTALSGYAIMSLFCGFVIAIVFQLAHLVEGTQFILPSGEVDTSWQIHELSTTSDFSTQSKSVTWLLGGLNFQVEHHLFSKISHVHYAALNRIIRQTCAEYSIPYLEQKTLLSAVISHIKFLKNMGMTLA